MLNSTTSLHLVDRTNLVYADYYWLTSTGCVYRAKKRLRTTE